MATAYTPGLTVSGDIIVRRTRRLPIKGEVLVAAGAHVMPDQVVARAKLPGLLQTIKMSEKLGVEARDVSSVFKMKPGDEIQKDQVIAETKALFGLMKTRVTSEYTGTIESISDVTGSVFVREPPIPIDVKAYIEGKVADVMPEEGAVIESRCAMIQGIFGVGGERLGTIHVVVDDPQTMLDERHITAEHRGKILIGGAGMTGAALKKASDMGVAGLVAGGIKDSDLMQFLGYDIGVAITGQEAISISVMVTEGFGELAMARRSFELFRTLEGCTASMNGATQIRAGVVRPEVIVPLKADAPGATTSHDVFELKIGTPIRVIREPYFGLLGAVTGLPAQLATLESGTQVRVLTAKLSDGRDVTVPRANVEIIASS